MTYTASYLQSIRPGTHRIRADGGKATDIASVSFYVGGDGRVTISGYRVNPRPGWRNTTFMITEGCAADAARYQVEEIKEGQKA